MYRSEPTVLAWRDARTAALYFDKVVPAELVDLRRHAEDDPIYYEVLWDLLPPALLQQPTRTNVTGLNEAVIAYASHYYIAFPEYLGITELPRGETFEQRRQKQQPQLVRAFTDYVRSTGIDELAVYGELLRPAQAVDGEPSLVLSNLDLVDVSQLSWRALIEFRKDPDARRRLSVLRRFIHGSYQGKSLDFVREDIERRISEYREVTRFWNFPTRKSIYTVSLASGTAVAAADILGLALFGAPLGAAIAGASTVIGNTAIALESRRREVNLERDKNPVAYLVEAERL